MGAEEDAMIRKEDGKLMMEPAPSPSLLARLANLGPIPETFGETDDLPPEPFEL